MMLVAIVFLVKYGRIFPLNEDWWLVPPLTGNEPNLAKWLWTQQSEHRIPLPRLMLLGLLKATHGDFRAGMLFNAIIFGGLAFFMIQVSRHLRGGRTSFADAFFPITLLHLGHYPNFAWSWMLTFNFPTVVICGVLLILVSQRTLATPRATVVAGISLVLLPLCGANGLIFVPILALWLGYCGVLHWRAVKTKGGRRWIGGFLLGSTVVALCLTAWYFVGYERPSWLPPHPGLGASLETAVKFLAMGFGPAVRISWTPSIVATIGILVPSAVVAVLGVLRHEDQERHRALGVLVFFGNMAGFALAMGWGRAAAISDFYGEWPIRYVVLAVPALFTAFFVWELYGPAKLRTAVQNALFLVMFLLIPFNTMYGLGWRDWFLEKDKSLEQDLVAGTPASTLAERHGDLLCRLADPSVVAGMIEMLHEAGIGPFAQIREDPVKPEGSIPSVTSTQAQPPPQSPASSVDTPLATQEIRYFMPEAGEVYLVWGLNGWHVVPEELYPAGTEVKDNVMHTPMVQEGDTFVARVWVPAGTTINYGFLITEKRGSFDITWTVWDGNYRETPSENSVREVKTNLTLALVSQEIRYYMPEAGEVYLVWGLNGWHVAPEELRPAGTEVKDKVMHTPMIREGDTFVAKVWVPVGTTIDYGFRITERRGIFDFVYADWDGNYREVPSENSVTEVEAALPLAYYLSYVLDNGLYFLAGVGVLSCTWLVLFFFLGFVDQRKGVSLFCGGRHNLDKASD
jgi:hypothetical protein